MPHTTEIQVETSNLRIRPLTYQQLLSYIRLDDSLEQDLGMCLYPRNLSAELIEAFGNVILPAVAQSGKNLLYVTLWTIIHKEKNMLVGDLCFKGAPTEAGELEIGYGTYDDFRGQGFMTEAVAAMVAWAFQQPGVSCILAETEKENVPSHKILLKNKFMRYKEHNNMIWWRLDKK